MTGISIAAMDYYLPEKQRLVSDIFDEEDVPFGSLSKKIDFRKEIGIETVRVTDDELPSDLALHAARKVMKSAGIRPEEIDAVVGFSSLPEDYVGPTWSLAGIVQESLGLKKAFTTGVNTGGCASYHIALKATCALMRSGAVNTALLVAGDRTPRLNKTYYPITVTSDGGSAILLRKDSDRRRILGVETYSIGRLHDVWYVPGLPAKKPEVPPQEKCIHMHCDMDKFNNGVIPVNLFMFSRIIRTSLKRVGLTFEDIDFFVYPSFSTWDQSNFMRAMNIPPEKIYLDNLKRIGHVQECDMVINYVDAVSDGRIREGDHVMVVSNGAGFAWSAAIIRH